MGFQPDELTNHLPAVYRYALRVTRDPNAAADATQATALRALERREQFRESAPLLHWLMRITHNLIVDQGRRAGREIPMEEMERDWAADGYSVNVEAVVERAATGEELLDALVRLPFIYRTAVILHDVEGLRVRDVADIHQISLSAAKQRLRRGRMAMVSAMAEGDRRRRATAGVPLHCWEARRHVSDYLNGDLDPGATERVEAHLADCPTCPPLYAALVGVHDALGAIRDPDSVIDPALLTRLREEIAARGR